MDVTTADCKAIRSVIEQQLQAFQRDDAEGAFAYASQDIQTKFVNPENFLRIVRMAYQAVYRPRSVIFETLMMVQGIPTQEVILLDPRGDLIRALYLMEKQFDGTWKINGCFLVDPEDETI